MLSAKAQSIKTDDDDIYSSGDETETFKTVIGNDHELLPLKQGILKKKSETIHKYNTRYLVLYPQFLLYYDQCPIKIQRHRGRKTSTSSSHKKFQSITHKESSNNDINHPKGSIFLRNYHVAVRKDTKKKRFDITFVPHESAVAMGLAAQDGLGSLSVDFRGKLKNFVNLQDFLVVFNDFATFYSFYSKCSKMTSNLL